MSAMAEPARPFGHGCTEIGGEGEERPGQGLRRAIAGKEGRLVHPSRCDHLGLQQRQHDVAAPEDQGSRPVEGAEQGQSLIVIGQLQQGKAEQEQREQRQGDASAAPIDGKPDLAARDRGRVATELPAQQRADSDGPDLGDSASAEDDDDHGKHGDAGTGPVWRQRAGHAPDGLRDNRHGHQLQAVDQALAGAGLDRGRAKGDQQHDEGRGQGKAAPCGKATEQAAAAQDAERKADLARRRSGQELTEGDEVAVACFVDPLAAQNELVAEVSQVRDRAAERGQPEAQKDQQHLDGISAPGLAICVDGQGVLP